MTLEAINGRSISDIAKEIFEIVHDGDNFLDSFGVRWDNSVYAEGDILPKSHQLYQDQSYDYDGNPIYPEGEGRYAGYFDAGELNGTCSVCIDYYDSADTIAKKIVKSGSYTFGDHCNFYLIQGSDSEGGDDIDEAIIIDAVVKIAF